MMTPQQRADGIRDKHDVRFERLLREAQKLVQLPRNLDHRANRMTEITDELAKLVAPVSACTKGCSHCCYQSVALSTWEAKRIAKFTKRKMAAVTAYVPKENGAQEIAKKYSGVRCPFLSENVCTIYSVRPLICRLHMSLADDAGPCDILGRPGEVVPYFNFSDMQMFIALLFFGEGEAFADIREFFPSV